MFRLKGFSQIHKSDVYSTIAAKGIHTFHVCESFLIKDFRQLGYHCRILFQILINGKHQATMPKKKSGHQAGGHSTADHEEHLRLASIVKGVHAELKNKFRNSEGFYLSCCDPKC